MLAYDRRPEGVTAGVSDAVDSMKPRSLTEGEDGEGAALTEGVGYRGNRPCQTGRRSPRPSPEGRLSDRPCRSALLDVAAPYPGRTHPAITVCCVTGCRVAQWRAVVTLPGMPLIAPDHTFVPVSAPWPTTLARA